MVEVTWRSVSVDVGWGQLRGKTCIVGSPGRATVRLVGVHGWLDNANTFDTLVPLLPDGVEVLVLDLPGHGLSDHLPRGAHYNLLLYVFNLRTALEKLGWNKFVLMGHSLGASISVMFTVIYPEYVLALSLFDFIQKKEVKSKVAVWRADALEFTRLEQRKENLKVLTEQEALDRLVASRMDLSNKQTNINAVDAKVLLQRAAKEKDGGYIWRHDPKVRSKFDNFYAGKGWTEILSAIHCPVQLFVATQGICQEHPSVYRDSLDAYRSHAAWFDYVVVEGGHHVHLSHPERVVPQVAAFLHRVIKETSKKLTASL